MNKLPEINIKIIPHSKQRYDTAGDYYMKNGVLQIRISQTKPAYEILIILHELYEWFEYCFQNGKSVEKIDFYDRLFEKCRKEYPQILQKEEPGDCPTSPYFLEHQHATKVEELAGELLGIDFKDYDEVYEDL